MSGHSRWSKVKHYKGTIDAKRGKIFAKLGKEMAVACKHGGGDPGFNPRLRTILMKARAMNMPADNIDRAIKKGTGELPGVTYEEITYEGYGPGGVALLMELLSDNKNRTAAEIRQIFTKHGGNMAVMGAVKHLFHRKGQILVAKDQISEDDLLTLALDAGAEDMLVHPDNFEILTDPHQLEAVHKALEAKGIKPESAEAAFLPLTPSPVTDEKTARSVLALIDALEDSDDVQNVYSNAEIPDEILEKVQAAALVVKILGIDPSLRSTGFGVIESKGNQLSVLYYDHLKNPPAVLPSRCLVRIADAMLKLIADHQPEAVAIEGLVYVQNTRIAFTLGQVRGVIIAAAAKHDLPIYEYAPRKVKQSVTGLGAAGKNQVGNMIKVMLGLKEAPQADAGDALAVAICHAHSCRGIQIKPPRQI